ncbi:hypothetical protein [Bordetella genomosp. 13]|uniref:hypothetical protein n=1 Tax=Bordetella genomosp. 13 TaxID=463040 RepID=UPI0012F8758C|nr:hypothetical protein [Bordetella genomosp. 13]
MIASLPACRGMLRGNTHIPFLSARESTLEVDFLDVNKKYEFSLIQKNITLKQGCIYSFSCAFPRSACLGLVRYRLVVRANPMLRDSNAACFGACRYMAAPGRCAGRRPHGGMTASWRFQADV